MITWQPIYQQALIGIRRVALHHLLAIGFVAIALGMIASPNTGTMGWFARTYGITTEVLALPFAGAGLIIARKPSRHLFALCMTPLVAYLILSMWYIWQSALFSIATGWFIGSVLALALTLYVHPDHVRLRDIFSFFMVMLGVSIVANPNVGTAGWFAGHFGLPGAALGLALMACALIIQFIPTRSTFIAAGFVFILYACIAVMASLANPGSGPVGALVSFGLVVLTGWSYAHLNEYWHVD